MLYLSALKGQNSDELQLGSIAAWKSIFLGGQKPQLGLYAYFSLISRI